MSVTRDSHMDDAAIRAWLTKYEATPFNALALATAAAGDPGPMTVFRELAVRFLASHEAAKL